MLRDHFAVVMVPLLNPAVISIDCWSSQMNECWRKELDLPPFMGQGSVSQAPNENNGILNWRLGALSAEADTPVFQMLPLFHPTSPQSMMIKWLRLAITQ